MDEIYYCRYCGAKLVSIGENQWQCPNEECRLKRWPLTKKEAQNASPPNSQTISPAGVYDA